MTHFNDVANEWDSKEKVQTMKTLAHKTLELLKLDDKINVLDFGCGTGLFGFEFLDYAKRLVGVDVSEGMLNVFDKKSSEFSFVSSYNGELENFKPEIKFDLILSSMTFHHLDQPEKTLGELKQFLSPNGVMVIVDLTKEDGTFHPNNDKMGVKHFGFAENELKDWASNHKLSVTTQVINTIDKNEKQYSQFMAVFK